MCICNMYVYIYIYAFIKKFALCKYHPKRFSPEKFRG